MTASVTQINSETPLAFIRRNGPTLTHEVAQRFFMADNRSALRVLKALRADGLLTSRRATFEQGAALEWKVSK